jgi:hypothetical protein
MRCPGRREAVPFGLLSLLDYLLRRDGRTEDVAADAHCHAHARLTGW